MYYDSGATKLYVWCTGSTSPAGHTIEATRYPDQYYGLIFLNGISYITIQNLAVNRSNYYGISVSSGASSSNIVIQNNSFQYNYVNDLQFMPGSGSITFTLLSKTGRGCD